MINNTHIQFLYASAMNTLAANGCCLVGYSIIGDKTYEIKLKEYRYIISLLELLKRYNSDNENNCLTQKEIESVSQKILSYFGIKKTLINFYECYINSLPTNNSVNAVISVALPRERVENIKRQ